MSCGYGLFSSNIKTFSPAERATSMPLVRAALREHGGERPQDEPDVAPHRPVGDIQVVELDHLVEWDVGPTEHLPETGEAGSQGQPAAAPAVHQPVLRFDQRPRSDETHLAPQHVPQLRQLVEARVAHDAADERDAWIV